MKLVSSIFLDPFARRALPHRSNSIRRLSRQSANNAEEQIRCRRRIGRSLFRRSHAGRQIARPATLTCHFFEFSALDVGALAVCMIKFRRQALLIYPIALAPLGKPFVASAILAAITMASVA
jgi:hypothetical protein